MSQYFQEYGKAKGELSAEEIKMTLYKIGLIQNEITRSQWQHMQQNRAQQEILNSFAVSETPLRRLVVSFIEMVSEFISRHSKQENQISPVSLR